MIYFSCVFNSNIFLQDRPCEAMTIDFIILREVKRKFWRMLIISWDRCRAMHNRLCRRSFSCSPPRLFKSETEVWVGIIKFKIVFKTGFMRHEKSTESLKGFNDHPRIYIEYFRCYFEPSKNSIFFIFHEWELKEEWRRNEAIKTH